MIYYSVEKNNKIITWTKSERMAKLLNLTLKCKDDEIETNDNINWYLKGFAPKSSESEKILQELEKIEAQTGYNRLTRDLCFSVKKLGGSINQTVYKKMLEIETLAKKYRKQLKNEQSKTNGDLED